MTTTQKTNMPASTGSRPASNPQTEAPLPRTATYGEAYALLSSIAERLRATGVSANIDRLAADLREARAAHAVCRARLAAIRAEIDQEVAALDSDAAAQS